MGWLWLKSAVDVVNPDKFRVKVITLVDGTKKYYPQYKGENSSNWVNILVTDKGNIILVDLADHVLVDGNHHDTDIELSKSTIETYKKLLELERAKLFQSEEVIKL